MKVIDLLNKIAKGEEIPKKVKYKTFYWEYKEEEKDFKDNENDWVFSCSNYDIPEMLNEEIEIIEEEKDIEEIDEIIKFQDLATPYGHNEQMFMKFLIIHQNKIDELVREVNKLKNNVSDSK